MEDITPLYNRYRHFELLTDSRQLTDPERTLFFALTGERTDGHQFIPQLIAAGVKHFVVTEAWWCRTFEQPDKVEDLTSYTEATFIAVEDVLQSLQALAAHHRRQFDIPVIGITGSNGKTIVKDWLTQLLESTHKVCASPRSFNSQLGVPLSVWQLDDSHEIAVFEAGISQAGEMEKLRAIIQPTHGIFTVLGPAHAAGFRDRWHKLEEKLKLFNGCKWVLSGIQEMAVLERIAMTGEKFHSTKVFESAALQHLPRPFQNNARVAIAAARLFGVEESMIWPKVNNFQPIEHRLKIRAAANRCTIIDDTYSNDLKSLSAAIQFAQEQSGYEKFTLIVSDILQDNLNPEELYGRLAIILKEKVKRIFAVGEQVGILADLLPDIPVHVYRSTTDLITNIDQHQFREEVILIKGARVFRLEQLMDSLTRRRHRTVLEVNLTAITHNFSVYRRQLPDGAGLAVMVKASAYGSGSIQVARTVAEAGARYLIVAYTDEGIQLREAGIVTPIMVLNPEQGEFSLLVKNQLEPVIANQKNLELAVAHYPNLPLHLEFDTGMRRLGFSVASAKAIACYFVSQNRAAPESIFTHLAASESEEHDDYTRSQLRQYEEIIAAFAREGVSPAIRHVLNTNGLSRFPQYAYEMARLGIGLYGLGDATLAQQLQQPLTLKAAISGIQELKKGQTIGYGLKGVMPRDGRIGIVSIGYADGLPRFAGEGKYSLLIHGKPAPIIGTVCMDMCMVDLSDHQEVQIDAEVIIFGPQHPIEKLAEVARTIPYEILTGIGARVHRLYTRE